MQSFHTFGRPPCLNFFYYRAKTHAPPLDVKTAVRPENLHNFPQRLVSVEFFVTLHRTILTSGRPKLFL